MKCLSISQPYADLVIQGKKTIELRTWNTKFRGDFLVHAPLKIKMEACKKLGIRPHELLTGVILGRVEIYGVRTYKTEAELRSDYDKHFAIREYLDRRYGFLLRNPVALRVPIPYKGKLGFFEVSLASKISSAEIATDLFDEEHRYQWIGKH